jgi:hypothetical protein
MNLVCNSGGNPFPFKGGVCEGLCLQAFDLPISIVLREPIYLWTRIHRYRGLFRPLGAFMRTQFSADYIIGTFGFDLRQGHAHAADANEFEAHLAISIYFFQALAIIVKNCGLCDMIFS